jgi:hypothetical protein
MSRTLRYRLPSAERVCDVREFAHKEREVSCYRVCIFRTATVLKHLVAGFNDKVAERGNRH